MSEGVLSVLTGLDGQGRSRRSAVPPGTPWRKDTGKTTVDVLTDLTGAKGSAQSFARGVLGGGHRLERRMIVDGRPDETGAVGGPSASPPPPKPEHLAAVQAVRAELLRLEELLCGGRHPVSSATARVTATAKGVGLPAWQRVTKGEQRWAVTAAIGVAVVLQLVLPDRLAFRPHWLLPALEAMLVAVLIALNPVRIAREHRWLRPMSMALIALISLANGWSAGLLVLDLLTARAGEDPGPLFGSGGAIWLTNVIAFALWYWEFDRGGPVARALAKQSRADFRFPQMEEPAAHPDWEPHFVDYFYFSFTNATAFSPTDVMPMSRWAKVLMLGQSSVSLITVCVVISRAVSLFK